MKTTITFIICIFCTLLFSQERIKIVASASMFADMAENIAKDKADIFTIVPIGGDPHIYEATPSDVQLVKSADIIFVNGLSFEGWINELIAYSGSTAKVITITEGLRPLQSSEYDNAFDPHAWMSVKNGYTYIENIYQALADLKPAYRPYFKENYTNYLGELVSLDSYIQKSIASIPKEKRVLVTSHDAFEYFGQEYGLQLEALMGISTDAEAIASDVARVSSVIQSSGIPAIFIESTINPKMVNQIAKDNNVSIGGELYADSLGEKDSDGGTYIGMLKSNTDVITNALKGIENAETKLDSDVNIHPFYLYGSIALLLIGNLFFMIYKLR